MSREIECAAEKTFVSVVGSGHAKSLFHDRDTLRQCLGQVPARKKARAARPATQLAIDYGGETINRNLLPVQPRLRHFGPSGHDEQEPAGQRKDLREAGRRGGESGGLSPSATAARSGASSVSSNPGLQVDLRATSYIFAAMNLTVKETKAR